MTESDPRICPHCGSDTYVERQFARVLKTLDRVRREYERQAAAFAVDRAKWILEGFAHQEEHKFLQQKAQKQRQTINRLEKKLRDRGVVPYEESPAVKA